MAATASKETKNTVEGFEQSYSLPKIAFAEDIVPGSSGDKFRLHLSQSSQNLLRWTSLCRAKQ